MSGRIEEIRVNPDGTVLVVKFEGFEDWWRVTTREGKVLGGPADPVSPKGWPAIVSVDPRSVGFIPSPGMPLPNPHSFTFTPTDGPQLVYFEGGGMSIVDHENHQTDDMDTRNLYILDALLRLAQQRTAREIERRRVAGQ